MTTDFDAIADAVARGEIILFLGAGVHASPDPQQNLPWQHPDKQRPLFAGELAESLAKESGWYTRFDPTQYPAKRNFTRVTLDHELNIENDRSQVAKGQLPLASYLVNRRTDAIDLRAKGRVQLANRVRAAVSVGKQPSLLCADSQNSTSPSSSPPTTTRSFATP